MLFGRSEKMSFGVIPYTTRVFFLIPWRFFPGSECSWYNEHLTNVTQDVKITWKMEGWPYQRQKVAYSGAQERGGFPWKQLCKNLLVLVLGFNLLCWSCSMVVHLVIVVVSERKHDFTFLKQPYMILTWLAAFSSWSFGSLSHLPLGNVEKLDWANRARARRWKAFLILTRYSRSVFLAGRPSSNFSRFVLLIFVSLLIFCERC